MGAPVAIATSTRNTLTVVQVALAVVLLIGSGLMLRTYQSMRRVQPGFTDPATLQTLRIAIPREAAADDAALAGRASGARRAAWRVCQASRPPG